MKINNKPNNLTINIKFSLFAIIKIYFILIFNSISGNCDPLFSQKNFDHTHFGGFLSSGFLARGNFVQGFLSGGFCQGGGLCPRTMMYYDTSKVTDILCSQDSLSSKICLRYVQKF